MFLQIKLFLGGLFRPLLRLTKEGRQSPIQPALTQSPVLLASDVPKVFNIAVLLLARQMLRLGSAVLLSPTDAAIGFD